MKNKSKVKMTVCKNENYEMGCCGYVVSEHAPNRINGRLFEIIEALGLPDKQAESIKSIIRKNIWEEFSGDEGAIFITKKRYGETCQDYYKMCKEVGNGLKMAI